MHPGRSGDQIGLSKSPETDATPIFAVQELALEHQQAVERLLEDRWTALKAMVGVAESDEVKQPGPYWHELEQGIYQSDRHSHVALDTTGNVIGLMVLHKGADHGWCIDVLYAAVDWQKSGVLTRLLEQALNYALDGQSVEARVVAADRPMRSFYQGRGFVESDVSDLGSNDIPTITLVRGHMC